MTEIGGVTFAARDFEELFKMEDLRCAGDDPDCIRLQIVEAVIDRSDVAGCVIESAVTLSNNRGLVV